MTHAINKLAPLNAFPDAAYNAGVDRATPFTIATNPTGFEDLVSLTVARVTPTGSGTGTLSLDGLVWTYSTDGRSPLLERATDLYPGSDPAQFAVPRDLRMWIVNIRDLFSGEEDSVCVSSMFEYLVSNGRCAHAVDYVWDKYGGATKGWQKGSYSSSGNGTYSETVRWAHGYGPKSVYYYDPALACENILASVMCHETVHFLQSRSTAADGVKGKKGWEERMGNVTQIPGIPPGIPSMPSGWSPWIPAWGWCELPAYQAEVAATPVTGVALLVPKTDAYFKEISQAVVFFNWVSALVPPGGFPR